MKLENATAAQHVPTTPEELRLIADYMDAVCRIAQSGNKITVLAEGNILFVYSPIIKSKAATDILKPYKSFSGNGDSKQEEPVLQN